jgi:DNA-binding MarR family transcriptional regulator
MSTDRRAPVEAGARALEDLLGTAIVFHHAAARRHGLTLIQWAVLKSLDQRGPLAPSELAEQFGISRPAVTSSITTLESGGWIARSVGGADRRRRETTLTARSREALRRVAEERRRFLAAGISRLPAREQEALARSASRLVALLSTGEGPAPSRPLRSTA